MKKLIFTLVTLFIYSSQVHANIDNLLKDKDLEAISCNDISNYDHNAQKYELNVNLDFKNKKLKEVVLTQKYGKETLTVKNPKASSDLRTFQFSDYTLILKDVEFSHLSYRAELQKGESEAVEVICGFIFSTQGE